MNKIKLTSICNITVGKLDSNAAEDNGIYPYFTCAPDPLKINTFAFDCDAILLAGNNAAGNFHCQRYNGKFNAYQRTYVITAKKGYDIDYIYYSLLVNLKHFKKNAQGSQTKFLTMQILDSFEVDDRNLEAQKKLSHILKNIDLKIANNSIISDELERLAKTIYDYWFLQFEFLNEEGKPYKSSGGKMIYNEELKREIPEGWEVKKLKELLKINRKEFVGSNVKTIDLSVMPSDSITLNKLNNSENFDTNLLSMDKGDILFGSIRPYLHKAGIAPCDGAVAGTIYSFSPQNDYDYNYCLVTMCHRNMFDYAVNNSKGTKMPVIDTERLLDYPVPYSKQIVKQYNQIDLRNSICHIVMENQQLSSLRDWLLPMLMNGQVTFRN